MLQKSLKLIKLIAGTLKNKLLQMQFSFHDTCVLLDVEKFDKFMSAKNWFNFLCNSILFPAKYHFVENHNV